MFLIAPAWIVIIVRLVIIVIVISFLSVCFFSWQPGPIGTEVFGITFVIITLLVRMLVITVMLRLKLVILIIFITSVILMAV